MSETSDDIAHRLVQGGHRAVALSAEATCKGRAKDVQPPLTEEQIAAIEARLGAVPGGDWHSALGSGHNAMTAVMADVLDGEDDYEPVFICDVIPDYRVEDPQVWENRVPLLTFIGNAPSDLAALIASHRALAARCAALEERVGALTALTADWVAAHDYWDEHEEAMPGGGIARREDRLLRALRALAAPPVAAATGKGE